MLCWLVYVSVNQTFVCDHSDKTTEDLILVVLFTVWFKVVVTFKGEILVWPFKKKLLWSTSILYIQMKAIAQYVHAILFIIGCTKVVLSLWKNPWCVTIQIKAIEQYFHVVLLTMLYNVVLAFKTVNETPMYDYSSETFTLYS